MLGFLRSVFARIHLELKPWFDPDPRLQHFEQNPLVINNSLFIVCCISLGEIRAKVVAGGRKTRHEARERAILRCFADSLAANTHSRAGQFLNRTPCLVDGAVFTRPS